MKKHLLLTLILLATGLLAPLQAQTTTVTIDSGASGLKVKNFNDITPLAVNDIIELGYFSGPNFTGTFTAISGGTITNTAQTPTPDESSFTVDSVHTVIGGDANTGAGAGEFAYTLVFNLSSVNIPTNGQVMSIEFFNNSTVASSSAYGARQQCGMAVGESLRPRLRSQLQLG